MSFRKSHFFIFAKWNVKIFTSFRKKLFFLNLEAQILSQKLDKIIHLLLIKFALDSLIISKTF